MRVEVSGDRDARVSEQVAHDAERDASREQGRCRAVPEAVERHRGQYRGLEEGMEGAGYHSRRQRPSYSVREDQAVAVLPGRPGSLAARRLLALLTTEGLDRHGRQVDGTPAARRLRCCQLVAVAPGARQAPSHGERPGRPVDVLPGEPEQLTLSEARRSGQRDEGPDSVLAGDRRYSA